MEGGRDSGERRRERDGTSVAARSLKSPAAWQPLQERLVVCAKEKAGATDESVLKKGHKTCRMECRFYTSCFYYVKKKKYPMGRVPSGERVMTNIEGTLGFDECVCVCVCVCVHQIPKATATGLIEGCSGVVIDRKRQRRQVVCCSVDVCVCVCVGPTVV